MFYCDSCAKEKGWPQSMFRSRGRCEVCGTTTVCSSRKSTLLPEASSNRESLEALGKSVSSLGGRPASEVFVEARRVGDALEASAAVDLDSLPPEMRRAVEAPPDLLRLSIAGRPSPPRSGGSSEDGDDGTTETPASLAEEALERTISVETVDPSRIVSCCGDAPPTPPRVPGFARLLSAEGFVRWTQRGRAGDDPALNAHCVEARRRWHRYSVVLQKALPRLRWDFPTFAPKARPYDWAVDA